MSAAGGGGGGSRDDDDEVGESDDQSIVDEDGNPRLSWTETGRMRIARLCSGCGKRFWSKGGWNHHCSEACRKRVQSRKYVAARRALIQPRLCANCILYSPPKHTLFYPKFNGHIYCRDCSALDDSKRNTRKPRVPRAR